MTTPTDDPTPEDQLTAAIATRLRAALVEMRSTGTFLLGIDAGLAIDSQDPVPNPNRIFRLDLHDAAALAVSVATELGWTAPTPLPTYAPVDTRAILVELLARFAEQLARFELNLNPDHILADSIRHDVETEFRVRDHTGLTRTADHAWPPRYDETLIATRTRETLTLAVVGAYPSIGRVRPRSNLDTLEVTDITTPPLIGPWTPIS